jgi:hypothetical protein
MDSIDRALEKTMNSPMSVRVDIGGINMCMMGSRWFDPPTLYFKVLPTEILEKLAILKMLRRNEDIPTLGRKHNGTTYYIYISPNEWKTYHDQAIPMLR